MNEMIVWKKKIPTKFNFKIFIHQFVSFIAYSWSLTIDFTASTTNWKERFQKFNLINFLFCSFKSINLDNWLSFFTWPLDLVQISPFDQMLLEQHFNWMGLWINKNFLLFLLIREMIHFLIWSDHIRSIKFIQWSIAD